MKIVKTHKTSKNQNNEVQLLSLPIHQRPTDHVRATSFHSFIAQEGL